MRQCATAFFLFSSLKLLVEEDPHFYDLVAIFVKALIADYPYDFSFCLYETTAKIVGTVLISLL